MVQWTISSVERPELGQGAFANEHGRAEQFARPFLSGTDRMTGEGSLGAPTREIIKWQDSDFADEAKLDAEMRRVFDICHGCRRCFNLCDSFPVSYTHLTLPTNREV